jgi:dTDP-4-amino-4,6-dideoxygalactose transaminase
MNLTEPSFSKREIAYVTAALQSGQVGGDGEFSKQCQQVLSDYFRRRALLTTSCTSALDMAAILLQVGPGDEVIVPSYTFPSTATAFVLRGATPVYVDIRDDTLNLDERLIEDAISPRTKAIAVVHYGGVGCAMDRILQIASERGIAVVEDAAQAFLARFQGRPLGTFGALAALSFHQTKNIACGEGGALILNNQDLELRAHLVREKGTNRTRFLRGEVDKYDWQDLGSSYVMGDILAAVLLAQLERAPSLTARRLELWALYHKVLAHLEDKGLLRRPCIPPDAEHNGHIYHIRLPTKEIREFVGRELRSAEIPAVTHYVPLHSSPAGRQYGKVGSSMAVTDHTASTLLRLPLYAHLTTDEVLRVAQRIDKVLS